MQARATDKSLAIEVFVAVVLRHQLEPQQSVARNSLHQIGTDTGVWRMPTPTATQSSKIPARRAVVAAEAPAHETVGQPHDRGTDRSGVASGPSCTSACHTVRRGVCGMPSSATPMYSAALATSQPPIPVAAPAKSAFSCSNGNPIRELTYGVIAKMIYASDERHLPELRQA